MKHDSNMEAESTLPECEEKDVGSPDEQTDEGNVENFSTEHEGKRKEAPTEQVDDMKEDATEFGNTSEAGKSNEKCIAKGSRKKKTIKVLKVKQKIVKKSPASNALRTKKAQVEQEDNKKEKEVHVAQEVGETPEARNSKKDDEVSVDQEAGETLEAPISNKDEEVSVDQAVGETLEAQNSNKDKEVSVDQEVGETLEAQNPTENSSKPESKTKKITKALKVKRKIVKKSRASSQMKTNKNGKGNEKNVEDTVKPDEKENANESISKAEHIEKGEETSASDRNNSEFKSSIKEQNNIEKVGSSDKRLKNHKRKEKDRAQTSRIEDKNEENLGGLIFMCSAKTKPDCFHYNVMGVSAGRKDTVLAIKPGLNLFLYDFDLRLLYGIYKASSSGGMKLEPKAFNGAFPAQVRFNVYKDCFPLPESIFKNAIQENYFEKHKFKVELSVKQVRKLSALFRPVGLLSSSASIGFLPKVPIRDRKVGRKVEDTRIRNSKSKGDARNDQSSSHGRDRHREEAPRHREEVPRELYVSEKDYRTYGLQVERRNLDPVPLPLPYLETYHRDHDRDYQLRYLEQPQREVVRSDNVHFNGKDYPVYSIDSRSQISRAISGSGSERPAYDPIYTHQYGLSSIVPYLLPSRRDEAAAPTYSRSYVADTEPMRHAAHALPYYNQAHHVNVESDIMPVSSRYSFPGPSFSYR